MEKVFAGKDRDREKFDLAQFRDDDNSRKSSKFSDQAYDCKYALLKNFLFSNFSCYSLKVVLASGSFKIMRSL